MTDIITYCAVKEQCHYYMKRNENVKRLIYILTKEVLTHSLENAQKVATIPGMNNEARARELAVMLIKESMECLKIDAIIEEIE